MVEPEVVLTVVMVNLLIKEKVQEERRQKADTV